MSEPYVYQEWPKWIVGPDGEGAVFDSPEDVPEGWGDEAPKKRGRPPKAPETAPEPEIEF